MRYNDLIMAGAKHIRFYIRLLKKIFRQKKTPHPLFIKKFSGRNFVEIEKFIKIENLDSLFPHYNYDYRVGISVSVVFDCGVVMYCFFFSTVQ